MKELEKVIAQRSGADMRRIMAALLGVQTAWCRISC
jgi:hypothetical protein